MRKTYLSCIVILALSVIASAQVIIDATGPVRHRKREPTTGSGGGVGRKLPIRVSLAIPNISADAAGRTIVEFTITNLGKEQLMIPTSPHPGDLEPEDEHTTYTDRTLGLLVNSVLNGKMRALSGGAVLFGRSESTGSLTTLSPGESIRILAKVLLPRNPTDGTRFVAYVGLGTETIRATGGHTSSAGSDIGYATSHEYALSELLADGRD